MNKNKLNKPAAIHKNNGYKTFLIILIGSVLFIPLMGLSVSKGAAQIPYSTTLTAFLNFDPENTHHLIIVDLRLPRVLSSALVGAAFAVSGALMQGVTRNPMADSSLMGLNAGASFALSICFAFFPGLSYMGIILCSFLGAALGAGMTFGVTALKRGGTTPARLVLAGAATSALLAALSTGISLYYQVNRSLMFWTVGGVAGTNWEHLYIMFPILAITLIGAILLSHSVSLLSLGEEMAKGLGINTFVIYGLCSIIIVIMAGTSVAVVGSVGFVGLIIPHLTRFLVGSDYRFIVPTSSVLGALLMVLADLFSRTISPPFETPIGIITALIGVPFFLYLSQKQRSLQ